MTFSIVLKHLGGELKTVSVEYVAPNLSFLSIRWGQSGVYDLNLKTNKLTARSQKAQRKGKPHWEAENIETVRGAAKAYLNAQYGKSSEERDASIKRHMETMPNPRIGILAVGPTCCPHGKNDGPNFSCDECIEEIEPFPKYSGDPETDI